ncbi:MAG: glycosyltransferase family 2 protein [Patescibacteria group bacterium]
MASPFTLSVVLPCFNEEENAAATVRELAAWFKETGTRGEIIAVDDGSRDRTGGILEGLKAEVPHLTVISRKSNGGYGIAVRTGCDAATCEWIGFMDSDGQFRIKDIELLLAHAGEYPFVTGRRAHRADTPVRNMFGKVLGAMNVLVLGLWVRDVNCGLKVFRREVWPAIRPVHGVEKLFNTEMFLNLKRKRIPWFQVNVPHYPRRAGKPTGGSARVILRMFKELWDLKRAA